MNDKQTYGTFQTSNETEGTSMAAQILSIQGKTVFVNGTGGVSDKTLKFIESLGFNVIVRFK